jgi:hypothetical protein
MPSEMTEINHRALAEVIEAFVALEQRPPRTVLLLSPSLADVVFVGRCFPRSRLLVATRETWDLNQRFPAAGRVDLVIASNVFHYAPDPARWFANVLGMTRYFMLQDLITRRRSTTADGLCDDGDSVRYSFGSRGEASSFAGAYDLSPLEAQIEVFKPFDGGRNEHHPLPLSAPRHYCALIRSAQAAEPPTPLRGNDYWKYRLPAIRLRLRIAQRRLRGRPI